MTDGLPRTLLLLWGNGSSAVWKDFWMRTERIGHFFRSTMTISTRYCSLVAILKSQIFLQKTDLRRKIMIEVSHLVKEFKIPVQKKGRLAAVRNLFSGEHTIKRAVDDITFSVDDGEIVGFIGKNGAGKSTTIKMLSGILQPTSGNVTVDGIKPFEQRMENAKQIGVVFGQKTQLWWDVPLIESYRLLREIYKN